MLVGSLSHEDRVSFMKSPLSHPGLPNDISLPRCLTSCQILFSAYSTPLWHFRVLFGSLLSVSTLWWSLDTFTFLTSIMCPPDWHVRKVSAAFIYFFLCALFFFFYWTWWFYLIKNAVCLDDPQPVIFQSALQKNIYLICILSCFSVQKGQFTWSEIA